MSVVGSTQAPRYTTLPDNDAPDSEPDEAWKQALRHKMEEDLTSMVADARKNLENDPDKEPASVIRPEHLSQEYHEAMKCIQTLFEGTFRVELERKRQERRSVTTRDTLPRWDKVLDREKKDIVDGIGDTQKDISGETSAEPEVQMRPVDNQGLGHVLAVQLPRQLGTPDVSQDIVVWGRQQDKKKQKGGEQQGKREEGVNEDERRRGQWRAPNEQPDHEQGQDHERGAEFPLRAASSRGSNDHDDNDFFDELYEWYGSTSDPLPSSFSDFCPPSMQRSSRPPSRPNAENPEPPTPDEEIVYAKSAPGRLAKLNTTTGTTSAWQQSLTDGPNFEWSDREIFRRAADMIWAPQAVSTTSSKPHPLTLTALLPPPPTPALSKKENWWDIRRSSNTHHSLSDLPPVKFSRPRSPHRLKALQLLPSFVTVARCEDLSFAPEGHYPAAARPASDHNASFALDASSSVVPPSARNAAEDDASRPHLSAWGIIPPPPAMPREPYLSYPTPPLSRSANRPIGRRPRPSGDAASKNALKYDPGLKRREELVTTPEREVTKAEEVEATSTSPKRIPFEGRATTTLEFTLKNTLVVRSAHDASQEDAAVKHAEEASKQTEAEERQNGGRSAESEETEDKNSGEEEKLATLPQTAHKSNVTPVDDTSSGSKSPVINILSKLGAVLDKTEQYKQLLSCDGPDAQTILDVFQMLLDTRDLQGRLRRQLITAMRRLSATTKLYPQSFDLDGTTIVLAEQGPLKSGSYADIHKAHFQGQALCLKVIRTYTTSSPEYMAKIYAREAILWGQLSHPNLLPLYGLFTLRSQLSFVSPWAENGHLTEYLRANPAANRVLLCSDAAAGVSYLHGHTIVHGDLKAANVLVDASGRARLADFGLSSVTDPEIPHWATHSSVASKGGTTRWQAPELLAPESDDAIHNTEKSDVFAWACLAYEVFTGYVPFFESARESSVILRIGRGDLPTCPGDATYPWVDNGLTTEMWNLMEYCWTFTPADRPAIAEVLVRLELEKPTDTRPPAHWHGRSAARFRTSRDARVHQHCPSLEDLDAILSRMGGSS